MSARIDGVQVNNDLYTGSAQGTDKTASLMTPVNLNRSQGTSYSTPNAGTEEVEASEKIDENYIKASISKLFPKTGLKCRDEYGNVKNVTIDAILEKLGENKKFSIDKLLKMKKSDFDNLLLCVKFAIKDSMDETGVIDVQKGFRYFAAYSVMALKAGDSKISVMENLVKASEELKEAEKQTISQKLNNIDINNEEELVKALKEYLDVDNLQKKLSEATTKEAKENLIKAEINNIVKLLHGASKDDMIKVGFALLKVVHGTGLVTVLDAVADMLIPDGMREKFIEMIKDNKDLLMKVGEFDEDEIKALSAYLAKDGTFEENQQTLDALNASLQKLQPVYDKIEAMKRAYIANQVKAGRKESDITEEEFYEYLRNQNMASEDEIEGHRTYNIRKAELEGTNAGFLCNDNLTEEQKQQLISQAYQIAQEHGFGEEFLKGVHDYIQEHGEEFDISQDKIDEILNNATGDAYKNTINPESESVENAAPALGDLTESGINSYADVAAQALENAQSIKEQIDAQTRVSAGNETTTSATSSINKTTAAVTGFFAPVTNVVEEAKETVVQHYTSIEAAVKENADAKFAEIKKMTGEATGVLVEYCFTAQNISDSLLQGAKTRFESLLTGVREEIAASGNLTTDAVAVIKQDKNNLPILNEKYLSNDEKQEMGLV